jgi:hypothetical protein
MVFGRQLTGIIAMLALGSAMGCADLIGADFDNAHPRSATGPDAAGDADGAEADATDGKISNPLPDVQAQPDVTDIGTRFDAADAIDTSRSRDARDVAYDHRPDDARNNVDAADAGRPHGDGGTPDARDSDAGSDTADGGAVPPPDGPRTTGVVGGFVSLGPPNSVSSTIELRGHFISNATIRGVTSTGISIEGNIQ